MFTIFITLTVTGLVAVAVLVALFFDVAFAGPGRLPARCELEGHWKPPLLRGRKLLVWAETSAQIATRKLLSGGPSANLVNPLVREISDGTTYAIHAVPGQITGDDKVGCPACCHSMIAVTPPEVISIAEQISDNRSSEEMRAIFDHAGSNTEKTSDTDDFGYNDVGVICPLLGNDDSCSVHSVRPLRCRGWSPSDRRQDAEIASGRTNGAAEMLDRHDYETRAHLVVEGAQRGFCSGLKAVGLDGDLYDLNSALVVALGTTDAAQRWADGERLFAGCKLYERIV